ncbi:MAG TPA: Fe-S cluster assembly protein SufD [Acidobacteriota bacterium]|jgi:Fe-S cluster assembly protein SufD
MAQAITKTETQLSSFIHQARQLEPSGPPWLQRMRSRAAKSFAEGGFPTVQDEDWKYTSIAPVAETAFEVAGERPHPITRDQVDRIRFANLQGSRLVFVNGHYAEELSQVQTLPNGAQIASLASVLRRTPERVEPFLGHYASLEENFFTSLNTAFLKDGAFVYLPSGCVVEHPIQLLFLSSSNGRPTVSFPRILVVAEPTSQAVIIETYFGLDDGNIYFTCPVTEIAAGDHSVIDHYKLQSESKSAFHIATLQYHQGRSSSLESNSITLGGDLVRNNLNAILDGEGAECNLKGLYLVNGHQHIDNHTRLEHAQPHCSSREHYKGILDGKSRGVFHGRILVHPGAQKTDSKQTNNNLLLSDEALINTKPQLEIYADDVKCTHGATIGQLDRDAVFYLRSRGIGEKSAFSLLVYAFASEIVRHIKAAELREQVDQYLLQWLPRGEAIKEAIQR